MDLLSGRYNWTEILYLYMKKEGTNIFNYVHVRFIRYVFPNWLFANIRIVGL